MLTIYLIGAVIFAILASVSAFIDLKDHWSVLNLEDKIRKSIGYFFIVVFGVLVWPMSFLVIMTGWLSGEFNFIDRDK